MAEAARVNMGTEHPEAYAALLALSQAADRAAREAGIADGLIDLVKLRTSQINGCAFCLRAHTRDALRHGETTERVAVLPAWRETSYFTPAEQGALALAESIALVAQTHVGDDDYAAATSVLGGEQVSALAWVATVMNALNRVSITSRYVVAPE